MSANLIKYVAAALVVAGSLATTYAIGITIHKQSQEKLARIIEQENVLFCANLGAHPNSVAHSMCVEGLVEIRRSHEQRVRADIQGVL